MDGGVAIERSSRKPPLQQVVDVVVTALIVALAVLVVAFSYGIRPYVVLSGSMEPALQAGGLCIVNERASFDDVREGDIIVFERGLGERVIHRVTAVSSSGLVTKGDANGESDGVSTTRANFIGSLLFYFRDAGGIVTWASSMPGFAICLVGVAALVTALFLFGSGGATTGGARREMPKRPGPFDRL